MAYLIYTAAHIEKKIVGQIFCFDWEEISEKMSKQFEKNNNNLSVI